MKKSIIYSLMFFAVLMVTSSCEKNVDDTSGVSTVTYFPEFTVEGTSVVVVQEGGSYTEPGVAASEAGKDLEIKTSVVGRYFGYSGDAVDASSADIYDIRYEAVNSDGYSGGVGRTVIVAPPAGDLVTSIAGVYTSTIVRNGSGGAAYTDMEYVIIKKTGANTYALSDGIGGYYDLGRSYGPGYAATEVVITANDIPGNSFSATSDFGVGAFGGTTNITSMTVDAANKQIKFSADWSFGYVFEVTLTQVSL